jgi:hypothetical protein
MKNERCSTGASPAVEAASRRLREQKEMPAHLRYFDHLLHGGRDARRTAGETPAVPGARR